MLKALLGIILAAAVVAAGIFVLTNPLFFGPTPAFDPCSSDNTGQGPPPVCFALNQSPEYRNGSLWVYPFQISYLDAGFHLDIGNFSFGVHSNSSALGPGLSVSIIGGQNDVFASYNFSRASWDFGSAIPVTVGMGITLQAPASLSGDTFAFDAESSDGWSVEYGIILSWASG
jgi:hypothetical protein